MIGETIILQFKRKDTSHMVISKMLDGLVISYGNPNSGACIESVEREFLSFADYPGFRDIHDGYGWNMHLLTQLRTALGTREVIR